MRVTNESVLDQFRGPGICEVCGKRVRNREPHHIQARGMGGGSRLDVPINLVATCAAFSGGDDCHRKAHDGHIPRRVFLEIVARREGLTADQVQERIWEMLRG